jgi:hypothetical protein
MAVKADIERLHFLQTCEFASPFSKSQIISTFSPSEMIFPMFVPIEKIVDFRGKENICDAI